MPFPPELTVIRGGNATTVVKFGLYNRPCKCGSTTIQLRTKNVSLCADCLSKRLKTGDLP